MTSKERDSEIIVNQREEIRRLQERVEAAEGKPSKDFGMFIQKQIDADPELKREVEFATAALNASEEFFGWLMEHTLYENGGLVLVLSHLAHHDLRLFWKKCSELWQYG